MHIADGLLDPEVVAGGIVVGGAALAIAGRRVRSTVPEERMPLVGVIGAFVFAAQMVNIPVPWSAVSTHLMGSALLAYLVGPWGAMVCMAAVLAIQAFLFGDGGILALGANFTNLGVAGVLAAQAVRVVIGGNDGPRYFIGAALAGYVGFVASAAVASLELILSGSNDPGVILSGVLGTHCIVGIGEAFATVVCLAAIRSVVPELKSPLLTSEGRS